MEGKSGKRRAASLALCMVLVTAAVFTSSCGKSVNNQADISSKGQSSSGVSKDQSPAVKSNQYPVVKEPLTLTMWTTLRKSEAVMKSFNEMAAWQEMEKATGIHIEFMHPTTGKESEQFNLMVASNDMPDIVWSGYFKSDTDALSNNLIIPLNDLIEKYSPNYKKLLDTTTNFKKTMMTDDGKITGYGYSQPYIETILTEGYMIRKDWLDKLNLKIPESIDDWEKVLTTFKEKDPNGNGQADEIPFDGGKGKALYGFGYAWGINPDNFYVDDSPATGKVKYGPMEPGFKEFLLRISDWYKKGLIDPDYLKSSSKTRDQNMLSNKSGATLNAMSGGLGNYTGLMKDDPNFVLWPTPWLKLNANSKVYSNIGRQWTLNSSKGYITAANKHPVETAKWFDWGYTKEGQLAFNFGKEGVSYVMKDGSPVYTNEILKNPDGLSTNTAIAKYTMANLEAPFIQHPAYIEQIVGSTPAQRQALRTWGKGWSDFPAQNLAMPPIQLSDSELAEDNQRYNDIKSYVSSMTDKFITGQEPISNYDQFVAQIKKLGIDESIKVRQDALERWRKRGNVPFQAKTESAKLNYKNVQLITDKGLSSLDPDLK